MLEALSRLTQAYLMSDSTPPFALDITIDRDSKTPLHTQISEPLASLILDGTLPAGSRLEDELSMAKRLKVSRPTARQALQHLVDRGLVKRRRAWARSSPPCTSTGRCS